ncbi:MAG: hypothetical protein WBX01_13970 [Nitrososphaeraceae archaeon]
MSQVLRTYEIHNINIGHSMDLINTESLEIWQNGIYKTSGEELVKVDNILEVLWMLDPMDEILLNLLDKIVTEVDSDHKKIREMESALEWIKGIAESEAMLPSQR